MHFGLSIWNVASICANANAPKGKAEAKFSASQFLGRRFFKGATFITNMVLELHIYRKLDGTCVLKWDEEQSVRNFAGLIAALDFVYRLPEAEGGTLTVYNPTGRAIIKLPLHWSTDGTISSEKMAGT